MTDSKTDHSTETTAETTGAPANIPAPVFAEIVDEIKDTLEFMAACGVQGFDVSDKTLSRVRSFSRRPRQAVPKQPVQPRRPERPAGTQAAPPPRPAQAPPHPYRPPVSRPPQTPTPSRPRQPATPETLQGIRADLGECTRCPLCQKRRNIVFGEGNPNARLMFIGEGPGFDEDLSGRPFVGKAGHLLTDIITKGMKLRREDVYIANIVKCRPPNNRNPLPNEAATCYPFLERQIAAIKPEFICTLGKVAAQVLSGSRDSMTAIRGRPFNYRGIRVMPTYHPAYLLRQPEKKRETWADIKVLMGWMGM